jgi:hypothetical protein
MRVSNTLIASFVGSLAAATPVTKSLDVAHDLAEHVALESRENGKPAYVCQDSKSPTVTSAEQVTGWTFPVSGAGCNAGSTSRSISSPHVRCDLPP